MARSTSVKEFTFGKKFVDFVTAWDFDSDNFAAFLLGVPAPQLHSILNLFLKIIDSMAYAYQTGGYKPENHDVFVRAQQMQNAFGAE